MSPGISISIDSIGLSPHDVFTLHGDLCGSAQPCTTSWTWNTDTASGECTVAVTQVTDSVDSVALVLVGTVTCRTQDACDQVQSGFDGNGSGTRITFEASTGVVATASASTSPTTESPAPTEASTARS